MSTVEVLVATMRNADPDALITQMNPGCPAVVVNQTDAVAAAEVDRRQVRGHRVTVLQINERGLSRSRNRALALATADVCLLADDDVRYGDQMIGVVLDAWGRHPEADVITFRVDGPHGPRKGPLKSGPVSSAQTMNISSVEISLKRTVFEQTGLRFDESFGAGAKWTMGEESIFLSKAARMGMKIIHEPAVIATLADRPSTWFTGFDENYLLTKGRVYREISALKAIPYAANWWLAHRRQLKDVGPAKALFLLLRGTLTP